MKDQHRTTSRNITRRTLLKTGVASGTLLAAPFVLRSASAQEKVLFVNTQGGAWTAALKIAYFEPFTAKTGIQVRTVEPVSLAKLKAQVRSGTYEWDVSEFNSLEFYEALDEDLIEPLDFSIVKKQNMPAHWTSDKGVPSLTVGTNMAYRTDKFPNGGPQSWADFWDVKKFPGRRSLQNRAAVSLSQALLADGVPMDKLYPLDIERAFKKLDEIKPHITTWWSQGAQSATLIGDGEIDLISIWNGRAQAVIDAGKPVQLMWNQGHNDCGAWFAPKGGMRRKEAMQFLNYCLEAEPQGKMCDIIPYGPSNPDALKFMSAASIAKSPTSPEHARLAYSPDTHWLVSRNAKLNERWAQWIAS